MSNADAWNLSDEDLMDQFARELAEMVDRPRVTVEMTPLEAWAVLSQVRLASRHPENRGPLRGKAVDVAMRIQALIASGGALAVVAARGWHPEFDQ